MAVDPRLSGDLKITMPPQDSVAAREWLVEEASPRSKRPRERVALLIHGYNVREHTAERDFDALRALIELKSAKAAADTLHVTWPGFELWYPIAAGIAPEAGRALGRYLSESKASEIMLVAHSLGCRLVLEALEEIRSSGAQLSAKLTIILMAAAVPVEMVDTAGVLHAAAQLPFESRVLYSSDDKILATFFKAGQTFAGEGLFPEAVGSRGLPGKPPWTSGRRMRGYTHGDYWTSHKIAYDIAARMDGMTSRILPYDSLPTRKQRRPSHTRALPRVSLPRRTWP